MTLPKPSQIKALKDRIEKIKKKDKGIDDKDVEKFICDTLRSCVRQAWMRHPIKLLALDLATEPDMNPDTRTTWKVKCAKCNDFHKKNEVEVDHKIGEHSLKTFDDLVPFVLSILNVTTDDLQVLCKPHHRIKTYSERYGHSEVDAEIILNAKDWLKATKVEKQKDHYAKLGYDEKDYSNAKKREALAIKLKLTP